MSVESKLQAEIIKHLRAGGAYVIKTRPGMGTPRGTPDIVALYRERHAELEVKASPTAPWQPGQQAALDFLGRGNRFVYRVDPTNWPDVKADLDKNFF